MLRCSKKIIASERVLVKTMNGVFGAYAMHAQEMEDMIQSFVDKILSGETEITITPDTCMNISDKDLGYMKREIEKRIAG